MAVSKRLTFNQEDIKRVLRNALIFAAPAILVLIADLVKVLPEWVKGPWLVVALFVVNIVTDGIRKFIAGK